MPNDHACCHQAGKAWFRNKLFLVCIVTLVLISLSYVFPVLIAFRKVIFNYLKSIWWAVTLGLLLGGVIDYYVPREYISKILARKSPLTIFNAVGLGFLLSACSHGILALSIQLHKKGASNPAVVSFLLASPWANFAVTMMLLSLFGLKGLFIIIAAIIIAINTGFIFMFLERKGLIEKNKNIVQVSQDYSIMRDFRMRLANYKFNKNSIAADFKGVINGAFEL
ncbi:MAG: permease, partial [Candidatus Omnitrophota bacterium]